MLEVGQLIYMLTLLWQSVHLQLHTSQHMFALSKTESKALFRYWVLLAVSESNLSSRVAWNMIQWYWKTVAYLNDGNSMGICCWYIKSYMVPHGLRYTFFMHYVITSGLLYNAVKIFQICFSRVMPPGNQGIFCSWTKEMSLLKPYSVEHTWLVVSSK